MATYVAVSARRLGWVTLDRPVAAVVGAVAVVAFGVLTPDEAVRAVDANTIVLLFGMMGLGAFLERDGFFERAVPILCEKAATPERLLGMIVWTCGPLSALITNDAVCVLAAPLLCEVIRRQKLPPLPFLLALATSANTGSVITLVGNPQNMLCASLGGLTYRDHLLVAGPPAVGALALNHAVLFFAFRRILRPRSLSPAENRGAESLMRPTTWAIASVIAGTAVVFTLGGHLAWSAVGGFGFLLLLRFRNGLGGVWRRIDWTVLAFFAGLFVVVEGFVRTGLPAMFFRAFPIERMSGFAGWLGLSGIFLFGSNIVSNVPFILVVRDAMTALPDPRMGWELLAVASTFAGNLTLLGSVANIIVAEKSKDVGGLGFWSHMKIGAPIALGSTLLASVWFYALS
ncbi:MAG: SLC13 family permease [Deltaproteobacteria bacterium]|nr:SLC13 family permease [Deltaproteobacteria bacterium]